MMDELSDLSHNQLLQVCDEWSALAYAAKNSFLLDEDFAEWIRTTAWAEEYEAVRDCLEECIVVEDRVLERGWMMDQIQRGMDDDDRE